jgi:hypothetical protein
LIEINTVLLGFCGLISVQLIIFNGKTTSKIRELETLEDDEALIEEQLKANKVFLRCQY